MALRVSIRDLHARTGHFVRKAAEMPIVVTDRGKAVAELKAIEPVGESVMKEDGKTDWDSRDKVPGYQELEDSGKLAWKPGQMTIDEILDDVKADRI